MLVAHRHRGFNTTIYRWIKRGKVSLVEVAGRGLIPDHEIKRLKRLKEEIERLKESGGRQQTL